MYQSPTFVQQLEALHQRLKLLYRRVEDPSIHPADLLPPTLLELGVAAEEFQVATEELQEQNDQMATALNQAASAGKYYQTLFDHIPEACLVTNVEGKILEANQEATRLLQLNQSLLQGKLLITLIPGDWRAAFRTELTLTQRSTQPRRWSTCLQTRNGRLMELSLTTAALYSGSERALQIQWILRPTHPISELRPSPQCSPVSSLGTVTPFPEVPISESQPPSLYEKGETIPLSPQTIWIVRRGLVKLTTITDGSEEVLLGLAGPAMSLGIGPGSLPTYEATALSKVELIQYALSEIAASSELCQTLLTHCHQRLQQAEELLAIAGRRRVKDRLYHLLRLLKQQIGSPVPGGIRLEVRLTHEDLANACCTTRVTVTRLLGQLQQQKKLTLDSKSHLILHPDL